MDELIIAREGLHPAHEGTRPSNQIELILLIRIRWTPHHSIQLVP